MRKFIYVPVLIAGLMIASCADDPGVRWAQGQTALNDARAEVLNNARPCVESVLGINDPNCNIYGDKATIADALLTEAQGVLDNADAAIQRGEEPSYTMSLLNSLDGVLDRIILFLERSKS